MRVRLLGSVDVVLAGTPTPVAGLRRKAVLAALGLAAGRPVSTQRLIDMVWGGAPPATALNTLQSHISDLRGLLGDRNAIVARPPGYLLDLGEEATDVQVAGRLVEAAARADDPGVRAARLAEALSLWRDRPLADIAALPAFDREAERLTAMWLDATQSLVEARLALGQHTDLVARLRELTGRYPHHEPFARQLMLALYRSGRQADALAAFHRLRSSLAGELGIEPGREVREVQAAILRHDSALDGSAGPLPPGPVPRQLPAAVPGFTGRVGYLADLDAHLDLVRDSPTVVISVLSGTAGVGKTTLAVHWAHRVAPRFPDGQLYADLRGFDPAGRPAEPTEVLHGFLQGLGRPDGRIPAGLAAQSALYRSLLAGRRVLVLLDNAADVGQVRPLLPGAAGCLVVVASRNQLTGLVAAEGARPLLLDVPTLDEARDMLQERLGVRRVAEEPDAIRDIVEGCARLPLALAVVAARTALQPRLPLRAVAADLRDGTDPLSVLDGGDTSTDVRAVFSWSYRQLSPAAGRLFRLLGTHPGPDVSAAAAASLAGLPLPRVRPLLAELVRATLLAERGSGRYTSHDLLRAYAAELARAGDAEERAAANGRMLDHYLHTGYAANRLVEPARQPLDLPPARTGVRPEELPDQDAALAWLQAEHPVVVRLITGAAVAGEERYAWQLAWTVLHHIFRLGNWTDAEAVQRRAVEAARQLRDPMLEAREQCNLASVYARWDRVDEARDHLRQALDVSRGAGDELGQAHAHYTLAYLEQRQGRYVEALAQLEQARDRYQALGQRHTYAHAMNGIGRLYAQLGDYARSLSACESALALMADVDDRLGLASALDNAGFAHHHLGRHPEAIACYQRAVRIFQEMGDRDDEASTSEHLGDTHLAAGDPVAARRAWQRALALLDAAEQGAADADQLRAKLDAPAA